MPPWNKIIWKIACSRRTQDPEKLKTGFAQKGPGPRKVVLNCFTHSTVWQCDVCVCVLSLSWFWWRLFICIKLIYRFYATCSWTCGTTWQKPRGVEKLKTAEGQRARTKQKSIMRFSEVHFVCTCTCIMFLILVLVEALHVQNRFPDPLEMMLVILWRIELMSFSAGIPLDIFCNVCNVCDVCNVCNVCNVCI